MALFTDFSQGVNNRINPFKLSVNYAQTMVNIDYDGGILQPIRGNKLFSNSNEYPYWYNGGNRLVSYPNAISMVEYRGILYLSNGTKMLKDGTVVPLGIAKPTIKPIVTSKTTTNVKVEADADALRIAIQEVLGTTSLPIEIEPKFNVLTNEARKGVTDLQDTYKYVYTYYDSNLDIESPPSDISEEVLGLGGTIEVAPSPNVSVNSIRLYRSGTGLDQFTLVDTLANINAIYTDEKETITIAGGTVLDSFHSFPPPSDMKYLNSIYAMLFMVKGNKLFYSDIGQPDSWNGFNFLTFDEDITGYGAVANGILVFTRYKTYIVTGNSPATFSYYLLSSEQGCVNHYTIAYVDGMLLWLSEDGICSSNGGAIRVESRPTLGKLSITSSVNAIVHDSAYYLSYKEDGIDTILVADFKLNRAYRKLQLGVERLVRFNDNIYGYKDGNLYELLKGDTYLTMHYRSGKVIKGSESKIFKEFFIHQEDKCDLTIYVDGKEVANSKLEGRFLEYKLPTVHGHYAEIEIKGNTAVYEFELPMRGRTNG